MKTTIVHMLKSLAEIPSDGVSGNDLLCACVEESSDPNQKSRQRRRDIMGSVGRRFVSIEQNVQPWPRGGLNE
jgi:hypothetical protein